MPSYRSGIPACHANAQKGAGATPGSSHGMVGRLAAGVRYRWSLPMSMQHFSKSPPELVARFAAMTAALTAALPDVERRQMFGYPCLFVSGNLVTGLHQAAWFVRLADTDRAELLQLPGAGPFEPMPGRPMGGYLVLPPDVTVDDAAVRGWVERAVAFGRTLPPKAPRTSRAARARKPS